MSAVHAFPSIPTRIMLPVDFSPASKAALEMASDLANHFHAELYLLNVIPMSPSPALPDMIRETAITEAARTYAKQHFAKCKTDLAARGIRFTSSVEIGDNIAETIMEVVDREHIDMIVISTHGLSGWRPFVFGSIAEKIIKLAQCPLLLLHAARPEDGVKATSRTSGEWW